MKKPSEVFGDVDPEMFNQIQATENYGKFICLSKEMEEKVSEMSDEEINCTVARLAHSLRKVQIQIENDLSK